MTGTSSPWGSTISIRQLPLPGELSSLAREIRQQHRQLDPKICPAEPEGLGFQHGGLGPIFDPALRKTESGRKELRALAARYHKTAHEAIRRYGQHHLILGDRYEANAPLPLEVVEEALPYVGVLSFQDFKAPMKHLAYWRRATGKPVLLADAAKGKPDPDTEGGSRNDGDWYAEVLAGLRKNSGCAGFHLCGAYQRNRARDRGLLDELERPDVENIELIRAANCETAEWMVRFRG